MLYDKMLKFIQTSCNSDCDIVTTWYRNDIKMDDSFIEAAGFSSMLVSCWNVPIEQERLIVKPKEGIYKITTTLKVPDNQFNHLEPVALQNLMITIVHNGEYAFIEKVCRFKEPDFCINSLKHFFSDNVHIRFTNPRKDLHGIFGLMESLYEGAQRTDRQIAITEAVSQFNAAAISLPLFTQHKFILVACMQDDFVPALIAPKTITTFSYNDKENIMEVAK